MLLLLLATEVVGFDGAYKMIADGGAMVLLGFILWVLAKKFPAMADKIAESHNTAIRDCMDAQRNLVEAFRADEREARSLFRVEQEAGRIHYTTLIRDERAACDERAARIEAQMHAHTARIEELHGTLIELRVRGGPIHPEGT